MTGHRGRQLTNINAGIKYMRWLIDPYYEKEPMTKLDTTKDAVDKVKGGAK